LTGDGKKMKKEAASQFQLLREAWISFKLSPTFSIDVPSMLYHSFSLEHSFSYCLVCNASQQHD
jgi:D-lyxose ketol-isomerase